jgi:thioredoxin-related protein
MMAAALLVPAACGHSHSTANNGSSGDSSVAVSVVQDGSLELPLPQVPTTLTEPKERAANVLYHFWDALDFRDTVRSHNDDLLEQNFANYLTLFPVADTADVILAINRFTAAAKADTAAYRKVRKVAYKYLYDPNSPMLNEDYYALFVRKFLQDASLDLATSERYKFDLRCIAQNRCDSPATDFSYVDRNGHKNTLRNTRYTGKLLLLFYDPECDECKQFLSEFSQNETLNQWIAEQRVTVLAVCTEGEKSAWQQHLVGMPDNWTVAYDESGINDKSLYILRAMPTLYILDADHRIVGKDVPAQQLLQMLQ